MAKKKKQPQKPTKPAKKKKPPQVKIPDFKSGDTVRVHTKVKEGDKERLQLFEGVVIKRHGAGASATFIVRKISYGVGVERIFPVQSPVIERIEFVSRGKVRRSKLYYLRKLSGRKARLVAERYGWSLEEETEEPKQPTSETPTTSENKKTSETSTEPPKSA